jgi:hypothetical protein
LAIRRLSSREEIVRVDGRWRGGGEATEVVVDAGVGGIKEDSGLVMNPSPSALLIIARKVNGALTDLDDTSVTFRIKYLQYLTRFHYIYSSNFHKILHSVHPVSITLLYTL